MKINHVTFTGADDTVEIAALRDFAEEFGFVEFGILFSRKRQGNETRYPTHGWLNQLLNTHGKHVRLAAHLCGELARDVVAGYEEAERWFDEWVGVFDRVQINGIDIASNAQAAAVMAREQDIDFIMQCRSFEELSAAGRASVLAENMSALYDPSGGRGLLSNDWPLPVGSHRVGYAGGIGPDNIDDVLDRLARIDGPPTWIDMETRVRSLDGRQFDLSLCRKVARAVARRRWP